jgi:UDP:flavonoid glycosyltransferase YjiC (YdhE family)
MHITLLALGSRGDVLPYIALGVGLAAAGHRVRVATFESFGPTVAAHGLDFHPIGGDPRAILSTGGGLALAESGQNTLRMYRSVMRSFGALAAGYARDLSPLAQERTDLILNQLPGGLYGYDLAEALGVPMLMVGVMPLTRTRAFPMMAFPSALSSLPGYNALTYRIAEQLVWQAFRPTINRWRQDVLGLDKWPLRGYFGDLDRRGVPMLYGFSTDVVPRPPDWGEHVHITGYWFPRDRNWRPPEDLVAFLGQGTPPVFIGFGSMPVRDPQATTAVLLDALARSGQRGVLHTGWAQLAGTDLPGSVYPVDYAPYDWLFPRMAVVVHHGGSGTTGYGLWAGVPSIVVPFTFDQFFWGQRVAALGVGPDPIPYRSLTAERLAVAIARAVTDAEMQQRAAALGAAIRAGDGVASAVDAVQRFRDPGSDV